jgi:predicted metal-dependent hydrolase
MMNLTIGETVIPYDVRESAKATRKRIVVTPNGVQVVVPTGTPLEGPDGVVPYLHRKRRWVFDSVRAVDERHRAVLVQQYASGAKLQFRGRWIMLDVRDDDVAAAVVTYKNKFHVVVPEALGNVERLEAVRAVITAWLQDRALDDIERHGQHHQAHLGVEARGYRVSDARSRWGSCGKDGLIRVHWRLVQAPAPALEYVVAHEVVHLVHRNHSPEFWGLLARTLPDWVQRKMMLERWEGEHLAV